MQAHDWVCRACGRTNPANGSACIDCGVLSYAHGAELLVNASSRREARPPKPRTIEVPAAPRFLDFRPLARGITRAVLYGIAGCGVTAFWVSHDFIYIAGGLAVLAASILAGSALGADLTFGERDVGSKQAT